MALENIKAKIKAGLPVNIGYFGGSITEGSAASNPRENSWRALTFKSICERFPDNEFHMISAAIGGTGSDLGMFRVKNDLLSKNPDLVFLEFAVNDSEQPYFRAQAYFEGVVRIILKHDPKTDIVIVFTATEHTRNQMKNNIAYSYYAEKAVARHYGIECIDVGHTIFDKVEAGEGTWLDYTADTVHPRDYGHALYCEAVMKEFDRMMSEENGTAVRFAEPMTEVSFEDAAILDAWDCEGDFEKVDKTMCGRLPHYAEGDKGQSISGSFYGDVFGIYYMNASDSGNFEWFIDGEKRGECAAWDKWALKFDRGHCRMLHFDLPTARHTFEIRPLGTKEELSKGTRIRIGGFLCGTRKEEK